MQATKPNPADFYLFQHYDVSFLGRETPYTERYLVEVKTGTHPITDMFRTRMAKALHISEAVLFAASEGSDG